MKTLGKTLGWIAGAALGCALLTTPPAWAQSEPAELFQRSYDSEATGRLPDALAALDRLPPQRQASFVAQLRRAWLLYRLGKYAESIDAYSQAITVAPKAVEARLGILLPQMALRRWSDVETQARAALRLDSSNYLATLRLAFTLYNLRRYDESTGLYRKLSELYPSDVEVSSGLGWSLLKGGKTAEAAGVFKEILEVAPRHALAKEGLKAAGG